ncbi:MAG: hypothetical protein M1823_006069 [Watsoniomyces obsoletus]|nr:MAG: hypothetical protein M1823_006069 [Watsoniomyces obsoletus]
MATPNGPSLPVAQALPPTQSQPYPHPQAHSHLHAQLPPPGHGQRSASVASASAAAATTTGFSSEQLVTLRHQILAFKMLSRNLPVPPNVQQQLSASRRNRSYSIPTVQQGSDEPMQTIDGASSSPREPNGRPLESNANAAETSNKSLRPRYESFTSPYAHIPSTINYVDHAPRVSRMIIPSIMPVSVSADRLQQERELRLYNRLMARKAELEQLPMNLKSFDARNPDPAILDDTRKMQALIEYKMINLAPKQRALRERIRQSLLQSDHLEMTTNRVGYRRVKKMSMRETQMTEEIEKEQRAARETREKRQHVDYLLAVLRHRRDMKTAAETRQTRAQKLGRLMQQQHQHLEKEEHRRIERTAKQRLQALKSNDEDTYFRLLGQAKDTRISHLLHQTNGFLKQLAASVQEQQRHTEERYRDKPPEIELEEGKAADASQYGDDEDAPQIDYYQVAHRISEEVKEQPKILVGGTLKEYQLKGLEWMLSLYNNNLNGILADEMGLGKTIQTISLVTYLIERKQQQGPFLVIVPLSTLTNWNIEFEKWAPSVHRVVYRGTPAARKAQQQELRRGDFQVLLTTYEFIIKDRPVLSKIKWTHMIVDEGHRMKNSQSKLSNTLTQHYTTRYRLILTGTPLQNNLPELWALLNFVLPHIFKSVKSFDEWFNTPFANTGTQDKVELNEEEQLLIIRRLHKVLRPFLLRRLKKDVEKDLPEKQERVIKCVFSALQAKLYKQMMTDQRIVVGDGKGGKVGVRGLSNMLMQLRKLCNHPYVFPEVEDQINPQHRIDDSIWRTAGKFELLDRILPKFQATNHRVLMFFQMTNIMNIMEDYMRLRNIQYLRLDGTTKADDRSELLRLFNAPDSPYFCFLLSTRAGGLGLNLQTADTVIIFDSDWNPHQDLQAQDRAHRIGQKNEVRILRLISANSVEEKILERAQYKLDMDGKVIQAGKFDNKSTNEERDQLLRTLMETAEATENMGQEEMDDDDLNVIMARSDGEFELFREIDKQRERESPFGPGKKLPRLLAESELPDIYLQDGNPVVEEPEEVVGRGARQRTQVKYDDGLTEEQWLEAVDADDDTVEDAVARKQARIAKRQANKEKRNRTVDDDSPEPSRESSEEQPLTKTTSRGRGGTTSGRKGSSKRKAEEAVETPTPAPATKRNKRGSVAGTGTGRSSKAAEKQHQQQQQGKARLTPQQQAALQESLHRIYKALTKLEVPVELESDDEDDDDEPLEQQRKVIEPFMQLPSKKEYKEYYFIIPQPICMDQIRKRILKGGYETVKDFKEDVERMCNNARTFNEDGSLLFQDANTIEAELNTRINEELSKNPSLPNGDGGDNNVTRNTSEGGSSFGTPRDNSTAAPSVSNGNGNGNLPSKLVLTMKSNGQSSSSSNGINGDPEKKVKAVGMDDVGNGDGDEDVEMGDA